MTRLRVAAALVFAAAVAAVLWAVSAPRPITADALPDHAADAANGALVFRATGCASCHAAPGAKGDDALKLIGGLELKSPFGTFRVPNVSPHREDGIGGWSTLDFANALVRGVSPDGSHYYPAMPYPSYARMRLEDVIDLKAYIDTLPAVAGLAGGHSLPFPFNIRRGLGLWKRLYVNERPVVPLANPSDAEIRGQYLVEALGHCGECHTPRDWLGGLKADAWLSGAPSLDSEGFTPNITAHSDGLEGWSADDIAFYLEAGLTPEFEVVGGAMAAVQQELAKLPGEDRDAIAAYLKAVPARPDSYARPAPQE